MRAVLQKGMQMREVKVKRDSLLEKIRENRTKHVAEYLQACTGYRQTALEKIDEVTSELKARVNRLKDGQMLAMVGISFPLAVPENHEKDYDQVIAMLEMSVDEVLTIRSDEFACYVMDDWDWKRDWETTTKYYNSKVGAH